MYIHVTGYNIYIYIYILYPDPVTCTHTYITLKLDWLFELIQSYVSFTHPYKVYQKMISYLSFVISKLTDVK